MKKKTQKSRGVVYQTHLKECERRKKKKTISSATSCTVSIFSFLYLPFPCFAIVKIVDLYIQSDFFSFLVLFLECRFFFLPFSLLYRFFFLLFTPGVVCSLLLKSNSSKVKATTAETFAYNIHLAQIFHPKMLTQRAIVSRSTVLKMEKSDQS